jgi:hypothetical protein
LTAAGRVKFNQVTGLMEGYDIFGNPLPDVAPAATIATAVPASDVPEIDRTKVLDRAREFPYAYDRYNPVTTSTFSYVPERSTADADNTPLENIDFLAQMVTRLLEKLQTQSPKDLEEDSIRELFTRLDVVMYTLESAQKQIKQAYKALDEEDNEDKYNKKMRNAGINVEDALTTFENMFENNVIENIRSRNPDFNENQIRIRAEGVWNSPIGRNIANIGDFSRSFREYMQEGVDSGFYTNDDL